WSNERFSWHEMTSVLIGDPASRARRARAAAGAVAQSVPPRTATPAAPPRFSSARRVRPCPTGSNSCSAMCPPLAGAPQNRTPRPCGDPTTRAEEGQRMVPTSLRLVPDRDEILGRTRVLEQGAQIVEERVPAPVRLEHPARHQHRSELRGRELDL